MNKTKTVVIIIAIIAILAVAGVGVWHHFDDIKGLFDNIASDSSDDPQGDNGGDESPKKDNQFYVEVNGTKYASGSVVTIDMFDAQTDFVVNLPEGVSDYNYKLIPYVGESNTFDILFDDKIYAFDAITDFTEDLKVEKTDNGFTIKAFSLDRILASHFGSDYQLMDNPDYTKPLFIFEVTASAYNVRFKLVSCDKIVVSITPNVIEF